MEKPKHDFLCSMFVLAVVTKRHWPNTQTSASFQRLVKLRPANTVEKEKPVTNGTIRFYTCFLRGFLLVCFGNSPGLGLYYCVITALINAVITQW